MPTLYSLPAVTTFLGLVNKRELLSSKAFTGDRYPQIKFVVY